MSSGDSQPTQAPEKGTRGGSPLVMVALVVALVVGVVFLLRRNDDATPKPTTTAATATASAASPYDLPTARKEVSLFAHEAELAHTNDLVDAATLLGAALGKDDCLAARKPYDVLKERKVDLTEHTALVLAQIRMLTTVGAYCNAWSAENGKRW